MANNGRWITGYILMMALAPGVAAAQQAGPSTAGATAGPAVRDNDENTSPQDVVVVAQAIRVSLRRCRSTSSSRPR